MTLLKRLILETEVGEKERFFEERTHHHIDLVQKAIEKICAQPWEEFDAAELKSRGQSHDHAKLEEPERTPYIELTWNKFKGIKDTDARTNDATIHHIKNNSHHPEYSSPDKANLDPADRDKSMEIIDAGKMLPLDIAEMIADWQAMSEELESNTCREWYNSQKDKRWKFSPEQDKLIDKLIKVFETREPRHSMDMHDGIGEDDGW